MAFLGKTDAEIAHEAAMSYKDRQIIEHASRFKRIAQGIAHDEALRREHSREYRVVQLGDTAVAALAGRVKDFDGNDRQTAMRIDLQFLEDGGRIDQENMHLARRAAFWSSRAEGDRQEAGRAHAGSHDFDRMSTGATVSMLGETVFVEATEFQSARQDFRATQLLVGEHSADDLRAAMRSDLGAAAERFMAARTYLEQESIALGYARRVVEAMGPSVVLEAPEPVRAKGPAVADYRSDYLVARAAGAGR
jgi:hypothetical protein